MGLIKLQLMMKNIRRFLGINFFNGHWKTCRDYCSSSLELPDTFIYSSISQDQFGWLLTQLHLNDNSVQPKKRKSAYDKVYKIRPLLNKV